MNKQIEIEDMAKDIRFNMQIKPNPKEHPSHQLARLLIEDGYRKVIEGEWVDQYKGRYANALYKCSVCGEAAYGNGKVWFFSKFCPSCGAKMKGESDEQAI